MNSRFIGLIAAVWVALVIGASYYGIFSSSDFPPFLAVVLTSLFPVFLYRIIVDSSVKLRQAIMSLDLRPIILLQTARLFGITYLTLHARKILVGSWPLVIGWIEIGIGVSAFLIAFTLTTKTTLGRIILIAWTSIGILDLLASVAFVALGLPSFTGESTASKVMTEFPLVLIPTFHVPLFIILHLVALQIAMKDVALPQVLREHLVPWTLRVAVLVLGLYFLLVKPGYFNFNGLTEKISFENGDTYLRGMIVKPTGSGPFPGVVFVHEGGVSSAGTHPEPVHRMYTNAFLSRGFAVLLFDKRGSGLSTGDLETATFDLLAGDVAAGVRYLRTRQDISQNKIGLFGRDEGGLVATLAAAQLEDIAFVIIGSGGAVGSFDAILFSIETTLKQKEFPDETIGKALSLRKRIWEYYRRASVDTLFASGSERALIDSTLKAAAKEGWLDAAEKLPLVLPHVNPEVYAATASKTYYDPIPRFKILPCPLLGVFGADDKNNPTTQCVTTLERIAHEDGKNITVKVFPDARHSMTTWKAPFTGFFPPDYFDFIGEWAREKISSPTKQPL